MFSAFSDNKYRILVSINYSNILFSEAVESRPMPIFAVGTRKAGVV